MGQICKHYNFRVDAKVNRLEDLALFHLDVRVRCEDCDTPFEFKGLKAGLDMNGAAASLDAQEARLSIKPMRK